MLRLTSKKVRFESSFTKKQLRKRFDNKIIPFKARGSIIEVSSFIKKYKTAEVYYGSRDGDKLKMSHHAPKKTDGSTPTFYGSISENGEGSVIEGKIAVPLATRIFAGIWLTVVLLLSLVCLSLEMYAGAGAFAAAAVLSVWLLFRDAGKTKKLTDALQKLCEDE